METYTTQPTGVEATISSKKIVFVTHLKAFAIGLLLFYPSGFLLAPFLGLLVFLVAHYALYVFSSGAILLAVGFVVEKIMNVRSALTPKLIIIWLVVVWVGFFGILSGLSYAHNLDEKITPECTLTSDKTLYHPGDTVTLSWTSIRADYVKMMTMIPTFGQKSSEEEEKAPQGTVSDSIPAMAFSDSFTETHPEGITSTVSMVAYSRSDEQTGYCNVQYQVVPLKATVDK